MSHPMLLADPEVDPEDKEFWARGYTLRCDAEELVICPDFLLPVADDLLDSGKSLILLRRQNAARLAPK